MRDQNKSSLKIIFFTVFMYLVGFGVIIPLFPVLTTELGATPFQVGLLMSIYSLMQFVFSPFWGGLSDRWGRRPILLICLAGEIAAYILFAFARSVEGVLLARALSGFFGASISTANAVISDVTPKDQRSRGMALIGAAFGLGFIFGPALGGGLSLWGSSISSEPHFASTFTLLGVAFLCALNFVFAFFFLKETHKPGAAAVESKENRILNLFSDLKRPVVGPLIGVFFLSSCAIAAMESTLGLLTLEKFGWGLSEISLGFVYIGVVATLNQGFLVRRLLPRLGERATLKLGLALTGVGLALIGFSNSLPVLAVAITIFSLGYGFINPSILGSISLLTDSASQGKALGATQGTASLGRIFGPLLGGWSFGYLGISSPYLLGAGIIALGLGVIFYLGDKIPTQSKTSDTNSKLGISTLGYFQLENLMENRVPFILLSWGQSFEGWFTGTGKMHLGAVLKVIPETSKAKEALALILDLKLSQENPVVVVGPNQKISEETSTLLEKQGFKNVFLVSGGFPGLEKDRHQSLN